MKDFVTKTYAVLRVAIYIRVSTEEQVKFGISLAAQEEYLVRYANEQGYKIVNIYRDEGCSARKPVSKRPVMLELLEDVKAGKIDKILITKFDRWSRNVREYHNVQAVLDKHNVTWQAVMENYDTSTADGRLRVNIMLSVNESEADRDSERIKFVLDEKRKRKEWCFSGAVWPFGYRPEVIDGVKRCVKDPETREVAEDFWDYVVKYNSVRKAGMFCCEKYGIKRSYKSWMQMSRSELYTGTWRGVEGYCEPYVGRNDWERIVVDHKIVKKTQRPERVYLFTGLIRCPCCGRTLKATFKTYPNDRMKEYNSYRCNNSRLNSCQFNHALSERKIEKYLLENITEMLSEYVTSVNVANAEKRKKYNADSIVYLEEQLRRLNLIYMNGNITDDEYTKKSSKLKQEIEQVRQEEKESRPPDTRAIMAVLNDKDFLKTYATLKKEDKRRMWRTLVDEIYIDGINVTGIKPRI